MTTKTNITNGRVTDRKCYSCGGDNPKVKLTYFDDVNVEVEITCERCSNSLVYEYKNLTRKVKKKKIRDPIIEGRKVFIEDNGRVEVELASIESLEFIVQTEMTRIPPIVHHMPNLTSLFIAEAPNLTDISDVVPLNLKCLALHSIPKVTAWPEDFHTMDTLEEVSIYVTNIEGFPKHIEKMKNLRMINVSGTSIKYLEREFVDMLKEANSPIKKIYLYPTEIDFDNDMGGQGCHSMKVSSAEVGVSEKIISVGLKY